MPSFLGHPRNARILVSAPIYATWNPAGTDGNIALSNGNLTAELVGVGGTGRACRTQSGRDFGRFYVEFLINNIAGETSSISVGIIDTNQIPNDEIGNLLYGYAWSLDGYRRSNGSGVSYGSAASQFDTIMMAVKLYKIGSSDVADVYFGRNGFWFSGSNPATETGPAFSGVIAALATDFLVAASFKTSGDKITANFGGSGFTYPPPAGYGAGWGENLS